jgi:uncharacterized protein YcbK (DUF882 family)
MIRGPSNHLSWRELACKDGTPYPEEFKEDGRVYDLANSFERIRDLYEKPIIILSAFRTPEHNRKIGGARNSLHLEGMALDLRPPKGISTKRFYEDIRDYAKFIRVQGIGRYNTFVHIDIRESHRLVTWTGTGIKDDRG